MSTALVALGTGLAVGALFAWIKLPIPAPASLPGILGAVGCFLGSALVQYLRMR
jgi:XapX domain-containing protein